MRVVKDLIGGSKPPAIEIPYNGDAASDSTTLRYKGSLVKFMDFTNAITNGACYATWAGETTSMEDVIGILEEEQPITGNYLPNDASYQTTLRKVTPIFPSTLIEAEYGQTDPSGTAITDSAGVVALGTPTTFTVTIGTADTFIGGWIYIVAGAAAGQLRFVLNNSTTVATTATAFTAAVATGDTYLAINPDVGLVRIDLDAHYVNILSEISDTSRSEYVIGMGTYISAPGIPLQRLRRSLHDGITVANARFYHRFIIPGSALGIGNGFAFSLFA